MNPLEFAANRDGRAATNFARELRQLHYKQLVNKCAAMSDEHALVIMSLRLGAGLNNSKPSLVKLTAETGLQRDRVQEILDDFRDLITETGGL
jgi:hypothetical protein